MSKRTDFADTPQYVLKSGDQPIYPAINFDDRDAHCVCIYGFSDHSIYDKFIKSAAKALTPYPLVKRYLSNQIEKPDSAETRDDRLRLVILDATDQAQSVLSAATMATVLLAQQEQAKQVSIEYELVLDPATSGYQFSDEAKNLPTINHLDKVKK